MKFTPFIFLFFVAACTVKKKLSSIKMADGYNYYEQASPALKIQLLGDYYFRPLTTKYFRDIDKEFLQYVTHQSGNTKPVLLYSAYTIVQPYYSTICLEYKTMISDSALLNDITTQSKTLSKAKTIKVEKIKCGVKDIYTFKYTLTNSITKTSTTHKEFILRNGEFVYRLFFWTTNSDDKIISDEAEYIIKEMRFN